MYDILVVDPPWSYNNKRTGGSLASGASQKYETMDFDEVVALLLYIDKLRTKDSMIFCWATNSFLREGLMLLELWGYKYKTMITWVKKNYGLGSWFRGKTEHCLFGVRGKIPALKMNLPNLIISDKVLKHSKKPEKFYEYVSICDMKLDHLLHKPINILELFARQEREGWTCIGKEITGNDIRTDLAALSAAS